MSDPFSIIGVIGVAAQIIQLALCFGHDWKDAPSDAKSFKAELEGLTTVLSELNDNILHNQSIKYAFDSSGGPRSALLSQFGPEALDTKLLLSNCKTELDWQLQDLQRRLQGSKLLSLEPDEEQILLNEITAIPNRTYLWVYLVFDTIQEAIDVTEDGLRANIRKIPETVEAAYEKILSKSRDKEKARKLLHIVLAAERPLTLAEMAVALSINEAHRGYADVNLEPEPRFRKTVRELCGLFITISDSRIYMLHQTAREFLIYTELISNPEPSPAGFQWRYSLHPDDSHHVLAEVCIRVIHLLTPERSALLSAREPVTDWEGEFVECHAFVDYAAKHWVDHLRLGKVVDDPALLPIICTICDPETNSGRAWLRLYWSPLSHRQDTALSVTAYFGFTEALRAYLGTMELCRVNKQSRLDGRTALFWAAQNGHQSSVKLLLDTGIEINCKDRLGQAAIYYAVKNGHLDIVKQLLESGADVRSESPSSRMPLICAIQQGHARIVTLLLNHGANVNARDLVGYAALTVAAGTQDEGMVKLLLDRGADVRAQDNHGWTALRHAKKSNSRSVIDLLLDAGSDMGIDHLYDIT